MFSLKCNVCGISGVLSGFFVVTFEGRAWRANEGLECKCGNGLESEGEEVEEHIFCARGVMRGGLR